MLIVQVQQHSLPTDEWVFVLEKQTCLRQTWIRAEYSIIWTCRGQTDSPLTKKATGHRHPPCHGHCFLFFIFYLYIYILTLWSLRVLRAILKCNLQSCLSADNFTSSCGNNRKWMPWDLTDDKSTLVQVMAWCLQVFKPILIHIYMSPYGVTEYWDINKSDAILPTTFSTSCSWKRVCILIKMSMNFLAKWSNTSIVSCNDLAPDILAWTHLTLEFNWSNFDTESWCHIVSLGQTELMHQNSCLDVW